MFCISNTLERGTETLCDEDGTRRKPFRRKKRDFMMRKAVTGTVWCRKDTGKGGSSAALASRHRQGHGTAQYGSDGSRAAYAAAPSLSPRPQHFRLTPEAAAVNVRAVITGADCPYAVRSSLRTIVAGRRSATGGRWLPWRLTRSGNRTGGRRLIQVEYEQLPVVNDLETYENRCWSMRTGASTTAPVPASRCRHQHQDQYHLKKEMWAGFAQVDEIGERLHLRDAAP